MKITFLLFLFIPVLLNAQINESDTLKVNQSLALTGVYQSGNVETVIFRAKTELSFRPFKNGVFKNQNSYVYQEFGKDKADEDILSLNFLYFNTDQKVYPFVLGFVSTNYRREINLRYLLGAGATVQLVDKEHAWLKASISSEWESTSFSETNFNRNAYDGKATISTLRGTLWANGRYDLWAKKMILTHEVYYQPSLLAADNFRWQADIGLEFPVWDFLNFKIDYRYTYESVVISEQKQQDQFLTFGFVIRNHKLVK